MTTGTPEGLPPAMPAEAAMPPQAPSSDATDAHATSIPQSVLEQAATAGFDRETLGVVLGLEYLSPDEARLVVRGLTLGIKIGNINGRRELTQEQTAAAQRAALGAMAATGAMSPATGTAAPAEESPREETKEEKNRRLNEANVEAYARQYPTLVQYGVGDRDNSVMEFTNEVGEAAFARIDEQHPGLLGSVRREVVELHRHTNYQGEGRPPKGLTVYRDGLTYEVVDVRYLGNNPKHAGRAKRYTAATGLSVDPEDSAVSSADDGEGRTRKTKRGEYDAPAAVVTYCANDTDGSVEQALTVTTIIPLEPDYPDTLVDYVHSLARDPRFPREVVSMVVKDVVEANDPHEPLEGWQTQLDRYHGWDGHDSRIAVCTSPDAIHMDQQTFGDDLKLQRDLPYVRKVPARSSK
jgi:hypothetical protein